MQRRCCRTPQPSCRASLASSRAPSRWNATWRTWPSAASARTRGIEPSAARHQLPCSPHCQAQEVPEAGDSPLFPRAKDHGCIFRALGSGLSPPPHLRVTFQAGWGLPSCSGEGYAHLPTFISLSVFDVQARRCWGHWRKAERAASGARPWVGAMWLFLYMSYWQHTFLPWGVWVVG